MYLDIYVLIAHKPIVEAKFHNPCGRKSAINKMGFVNLWFIRMGSDNLGFIRMDSDNLGFVKMDSDNLWFIRMDSDNLWFIRMDSDNFGKLWLFVVFKYKFESSDLSEWVLII